MSKGGPKGEPTVRDRCTFVLCGTILVPTLTRELCWWLAAPPDLPDLGPGPPRIPSPLTPLPSQTPQLSSQTSLQPTPTPRLGPKSGKVFPEASYLNQSTGCS